jgi:hypothetical protein
MSPLQPTSVALSLGFTRFGLVWFNVVALDLPGGFLPDHGLSASWQLFLWCVKSLKD